MTTFQISNVDLVHDTWNMMPCWVAPHNLKQRDLGFSDKLNPEAVTSNIPNYMSNEWIWLVFTVHSMRSMLRSKQACSKVLHVFLSLPIDRYQQTTLATYSKHCFCPKYQHRVIDGTMFFVTAICLTCGSLRQGKLNSSVDRHTPIKRRLMQHTHAYLNSNTKTNARPYSEISDRCVLLTYRANTPEAKLKETRW